MCLKILAQIEMLYEQITVATKTAVINKREKAFLPLFQSIIVILPLLFKFCDFTPEISK